MSTSTLRIAAVYAHPDDGEFFCAGTLAKWARAGHQVFAICATPGDLGTKRTDVPRETILRERTAELAAAMKAIGAEPPVILGIPDGSVREHQERVKERITYWLRKLRIDRVITFDPWKRYEIHPDHIAVGRAASEAAVFACFPLFCPEHLTEGLTATQPQEVWYMMPTEHRPNRIVDIRDTFDVKVRSVLCHSSQLEMLADWFVPGADPTALTEDERQMLEGGARMFLEGMARGLAHLAPGSELVEGFYALRTGPGHFNNYQEMFMEVAGAPAAAPERC